jgi:GH15 family glucan-1,4-alpha-glucosidase
VRFGVKPADDPDILSTLPVVDRERLAWSIDAGRPVEQPSIVASRYAKECR